jgi:ABC-2 type transport system ATP-binding protein
VPILECGDLRKTFADGFEAVRGITFDIREGEAFGLLGPNGAGKTTTMRMLGTLLLPTSGRAVVAGHDVVREAGAVRRAIGFAMQEAGLARYATGREHLHMMGRLYGLSRGQTRARADELLTLFGLEDAADRQVRTYSGGMRRRIDLACGLVHRPRLLFLDEPTTGVDPTSRAALWEELRRLQGEGVSLFLTTHYLEEADRLCDRLAIVDRGVIVARGTPDELKAEVGADVVTVGLAGSEEAPSAAVVLEALGRVRVAGSGRSIALELTDGAAAVAGIVERLREAGIVPSTITVARPTLDDVFLRYTGATIEEHDEQQSAVPAGRR